MDAALLGVGAGHDDGSTIYSYAAVVPDSAFEDLFACACVTMRWRVNTSVKPEVRTCGCSGTSPGSAYHEEGRGSVRTRECM